MWFTFVTASVNFLTPRSTNLFYHVLFIFLNGNVIFFYYFCHWTSSVWYEWHIIDFIFQPPCHKSVVWKGLCVNETDILMIYFNLTVLGSSTNQAMGRKLLLCTVTLKPTSHRERARRFLVTASRDETERQALINCSTVDKRGRHCMTRMIIRAILIDGA